MGKRHDLRQFQQDLNDRMQAKGLAGERVSALGIQAGGEHWLVEMSDIGEVLPVPPLTPVPLTKPWYRGVANVRGNLYSVVDVAACLGLDAALSGARSRVLLLAPKHGFNTGLLVSRVFGLRNPRNWRRTEKGGAVLYEDSAGQTWKQLDMAALLRQPGFLHIGI
jgi:twitching motility protein PilI